MNDKIYDMIKRDGSPLYFRLLIQINGD